MHVGLVILVPIVEKDKITGDNIYKILLNFENIFSNMDDLERKQFIELLIDEIQIHPEKQENGQRLKSISFKLPIIDQDFDINGWVNNTHVSTCFVLGKRSAGRRRVRVKPLSHSVRQSRAAVAGSQLTMTMRSGSSVRTACRVSGEQPRSPAAR